MSYGGRSAWKGSFSPRGRALTPKASGMPKIPVGEWLSPSRFLPGAAKPPAPIQEA